MAKRLCTWFAIATLQMMLTAPLLAYLEQPGDHVEHSAQHSDGAPCPDADNDGPCDNACPCFCCPGHAPVFFISPGFLLGKTQQFFVDDFVLSDTLHEPAFFFRVFRPPRL